jgi:hypothetical protein
LGRSSWYHIASSDDLYMRTQPLRPLTAEAPSKAAIPVRTTGF